LVSATPSSTFSLTFFDSSRCARGERGLAAVLLIDAGHDPQQRGLAGAVVAEHADLGARVERERDVVEHRFVRRVELGEPVHREDVLGRHPHAG
jgi:hypothetical protein